MSRGENQECGRAAEGASASAALTTLKTWLSSTSPAPASELLAWEARAEKPRPNGLLPEGSSPNAHRQAVVARRQTLARGSLDVPRYCREPHVAPAVLEGRRGATAWAHRSGKREEARGTDAAVPGVAMAPDGERVARREMMRWTMRRPPLCTASDDCRTAIRHPISGQTLLAVIIIAVSHAADGPRCLVGWRRRDRRFFRAAHRHTPARGRI